MKKLFVTGIGTDVGKTLVSAIIVQALGADYWKPVQAGFDDGTDSEFISEMTRGSVTKVHREVYKLKMPASPHLSARKENTLIDLQKIIDATPQVDRPLIIEGAGGLMVPLNEKEFVIDLLQKLDAVCILVSRNYLGSINHSLLTAGVCKQRKIPVAGWIFTDEYGNYEQEIAAWSGFPVLGKIPHLQTVNQESINEQAFLLKEKLLKTLI
jgi:dethiobiotin synthetase